MLDTVPVLVVDLRTRVERTIYTDGSGFFGAIDLEPGDYGVYISTGRIRLAARVRVSPGRVTVARLLPANVVPRM